MIKKYKKQNAFTMAEVLITLMILGIIAMITIPGIIKNVEQHSIITQIKVARSIVNQAVQRSIAENGFPSTWNTSLGTNAYFETYLLPYFNVKEKCGSSSRAYSGKCFITDNGYGGFYNLKGGYNSNTYVNKFSYNIKLINGMSVAFTKLAHNFCIDVNGEKGPSTLGKDIFCFTLNLQNGSIETTYISACPNTVDGQMNCTSNGGCNKNADWPGYTCARVLELNGWKFPANYPW